MTATKHGNILQFVRWAYSVEAAGVHRAGDDIAAPRASLTSAVARVMSLGTVVDTPSVSALYSSRDTHDDAEFLADLVAQKLPKAARSLVRAYGLGQWEAQWAGIVAPSVLVGSTSTNPHLGALFSWPFTFPGKSGGKHRTKSEIAPLTVRDSWAEQYHAARQALTFRQGIEQLRVMVQLKAHMLGKFRFDPAPIEYGYKTARLEGDVKVLARRAGLAQ